MSEFDWNRLKEARLDLLKRAEALKRAFVQMPGGAQGGEPPAGDAGAVPPGMDPAMAGMAGAMPPDPSGMDPMAGGLPPGADPAALAAMAGAVPPMGVDPAMAGMVGAPGVPGAPGMDPAAGAGGAIAGAAGAGAPEPTLTLTLSQLWDVVTKVLGLAKRIGANGQGVAAEGAAPQPPASQDAIKAAVIEALGSMGAMGAMKCASGPASVDTLEREAARAIEEQAKGKGKGTRMLDKRTMDLLERLQRRKGRRIKGYDSKTGFTY